MLLGTCPAALGRLWNIPTVGCTPQCAAHSGPLQTGVIGLWSIPQPAQVVEYSQPRLWNIPTTSLHVCVCVWVGRGIFLQLGLGSSQGRLGNIPAAVLGIFLGLHVGICVCMNRNMCRCACRNMCVCMHRNMGRCTCRNMCVHE